MSEPTTSSTIQPWLREILRSPGGEHELVELKPRGDDAVEFVQLELEQLFQLQLQQLKQFEFEPGRVEQRADLRRAVLAVRHLSQRIGSQAEPRTDRQERQTGRQAERG